MSVNSYLTQLANDSILREVEKDGIQRSLSTISTRITQSFIGHLKSHYPFGSYTRGTILPRSMDEHSDIDYIVIFNDSQYRPQTYLNYLATFAINRYQSSEIKQSHPTIVLSLNHIKFELVPAIEQWNQIKIPSKNTYDQWIETNPNDFNSTLTNVNSRHNSLIKPLARIMKYWNASKDYIFESYLLEKNIASTGFYSLPYNAQLKDYFFLFVQSIRVDYSMPNYKQNAINDLKTKVADITQKESWGYSSQAEDQIRNLLPYRL
ncbi:MAG: nucleotidyltransferase domain-containing protein [Candidatus Sericytochromatia bacterium]|nr:nucleotidyltransferase domain-containing protein [Candidatus Sericytochromatia bacterium]